MHIWQSIRTMLFTAGCLYGAGVAAATIQVETAVDQIDPGACSLRAAIINANQDDQSGSQHCNPGDGADEIVFLKSLTGQTITLAGAALPTITDSLTIRGPVTGDPGAITIDGNDSSRILTIEVDGSAFVEVELRNLTLSGGLVDGESAIGGALYAVDASLIPRSTAGGRRPWVREPRRGGEDWNLHVRLTDTAVADNAVVDPALAGGGVAIHRARLTMERTLVSGNDAPFGGGLVVVGDSEIIDSRIEENTSSGPGGGLYTIIGNHSLVESVVGHNETLQDDAPGGGIYVDIGQIELIDTELDHNVTNGDDSPGGGLYALVAKLAQGSIDVIGSLVLANKTFGNRSFGGGIAVVSDESPAEVRLTDSTLSSNSTHFSDSGGAGIAGRGLGDGQPRVPVDVIAVRSSISGNTAHGENSRGGGVGLEYGSLEADRSTLADNATAGSMGHGGGLYVFNESGEPGSLILTNSTVSGNVATGQFSIGGGVVGSFGTVTSLTHTTVVDNQAAGGTDGVHLTSGVGTELTLANSLIVQADAGTTGCSADAIDSTRTYATDTSCESILTLADNIGLGALLPNGGSTRTHSIPADSVAIDAAGDCAGDYGVTVDQRGQQRPGKISGACDTGAFEHQTSGSVFRDRFEAP